MRVNDLVRLMGQIAPLEYAEEWDRVGLLVGDGERELTGPVLLTIDLTEPVLAEAIGAGSKAIIAYHPPIFEPLARVTDATPRQRIILRAIEAGIAVYSPHTALDAVHGGITDWLCEGLSGGEPGRIKGDVRALTPHAKLPAMQQVKIVTFMQPPDVERIRNALASGGAGNIGAYQLCSFETRGTGTFLPGPGTRPAVGEPGHVERVDEVRLEMVAGKAALPLITELLRRFHPYEEPAIDVYELMPQPRRNAGAGRRLVLDRPTTVAELTQRLKHFLKRERMRYALPAEDRPVTRIGVVPGSGASLSRLARDEGCEVFVTGEMKHHEVLGALNAGMAVILGNHTSTERGYLPRLAQHMQRLAPGLPTIISEVDQDPLITV
ncbi:MAG TPA: Nif3-like dinuclear metal center hexameric protein [Phycisphaerales bacterium]|nr:Nif3-like dinuclear metal center hexameric protein [Phycisphaerales bacterium]